LSAWALPQTPSGGAYSAPPDPLAGFKGPISKKTGGARGRTGGAGVKTLKKYFKTLKM